MVVFQKMLTFSEMLALPNHPPSGYKNASVLGFQDTNTNPGTRSLCAKKLHPFHSQGSKKGGISDLVPWYKRNAAHKRSRPSSMLSWSLTVVLTLTTSRVAARNWPWRPWSDSPRPKHYFYPLQLSFYRQCCIKSTGTAWCFQFQASGRAVPFASSSTSLLQIWSSVAALSLSTARCMPRKAIAKKSRQGIATKSSSKTQHLPIHVYIQYLKMFRNDV